MNWIGEIQSEVSVKVRSLAPPVPAIVDGDWVRFTRPEYGVAPGQAAVFYDGERMLGGGWIAETSAASSRTAARADEEGAPVPRPDAKNDRRLVFTPAYRPFCCIDADTSTRTT